MARKGAPTQSPAVTSRTDGGEVDVSTMKRLLKLSPTERLEAMVEASRRLEVFRNAAQRR